MGKKLQRFRRRLWQGRREIGDAVSLDTFEDPSATVEVVTGQKHQWHTVRDGRRGRRVRGTTGTIICKRRGCTAVRYQGFTFGEERCI